VRLGVAPVASSNAPSPSRSHAYVSGSPLGSLEPPASKWTWSGGLPVSGLAVNAAVGAWFGLTARTRLIVPPPTSA
jgi:hypothetical protein